MVRTVTYWWDLQLRGGEFEHQLLHHQEKTIQISTGKYINKILYSAQCRPEAESKALVSAARENRRPAQNSGS